MSEVETANLAGPPSSVSGLVPFHNSTQADLTIEQVLIRDEDGGTRDLPIEAVTVPAGETAHIAISLSFQPQTDPGVHLLEIDMAGVTTAVAAHIAELRDIAIAPDTVVVDNIPEVKHIRQIVVTNQGNTSTFVADFGEVPLYREDQSLATVVAIARSLPDLGQGSMDALPEPAAALSITTDGGRVEVPPGESRSVSFTITVPAELPQPFRYLAIIPIGVLTLVLVVVPAGTAAGNS